MDYHTPWMRSDQLNFPHRYPRDGFISTRDERQAKHHCQRQTRLGRSLRIPKHRNGCSTVNRVRSSWPSLTTWVGLGRFRLIPERRDGCYVQTVQTTDLPNSSRVPFNQHSLANTTSQLVESKAAGVTFQLRSGGTSGIRTRHDDPLRTECESREKRLESQSPQPNEVSSPAPSRAAGGRQPENWPRGFARLESHRKEHRLVSQCSFHLIRCLSRTMRKDSLAFSHVRSGSLAAGSYFRMHQRRQLTGRRKSGRERSQLPSKGEGTSGN